jgi:hypothetical protein
VRRLLLDFAVLMAWFALMPMALAWHSFRRMRLPSSASEPPFRRDLRQFWEHDFKYWDNLALAMAGLSLLCLSLHLAM